MVVVFGRGPLVEVMAFGMVHQRKLIVAVGVHVLKPCGEFHVVDLQIDADFGELAFKLVAQFGAVRVGVGEGRTASWQAAYHPGSVKVVAYDENGKVVATDEQDSFDDSAMVCLQADRKTISGDKLVPFIELGVGFNPELTGRENVFLNGALLGFTREEIEDMYDDIVEFAELEEFMDQKLKNYSSGMQVRLAFSVAIQAKGDILVLDEVLAVGDEAFQRKCDNYFAKVKKDPTKTVILVTHDMGAVKKYCNKAVLIKDGEVIVNGNKDDVANRYTLENMRADKRDTDNDKADEYPTGLNARVPMLRINALSKQILTCDDTFQFEVEYQYDEPNSYYLAIAMHDIKRGGVTYDTGANVIKLNQLTVLFY